MKVWLFMMLVLGCCLAAFRVADGGISGSWKGNLEEPGSNIDYPLAYNLKADGGKLTGTGLTPQNGYTDLTNGKVTGNAFSFDMQVDGKNAKHSGKYIASGDSVSLDIDFNGTQFHSTLTRSK